ncbi:homoserine dehydrogenase [Phaffia rhodozyma]|uniref:Homoserine dehydrogenase n=1 Tax=Phaffia rhodozyma TaxID=264483 RepID=A0A0F7SU47_PHARH|nr:homoserine dehydrogenase [Phaffia rhodozyma]
MAINKINLCVLGLGGVGTSFLQILAKSPALNQKFTLLALANSRSAVYIPAGIPSSEPITSSPSKWVDAHPEAKPLELESLFQSLTAVKGQTIVVDNSSSADLAELYPTILKLGLHLCTPNKKGWSGELKLWTNVLSAASEANTLSYGESTVGAGLPILTTLKDLVETGDEIVKIEGVLSGTLSYIFNNYSPAKPQEDKPTFSSIIHTAKSLGYTEPDPRDDLSGVDVARKLTILSRQIPSLAKKLENGYASVPTKSLVPPVLENANTAAEYLDRLAEGDDFFDSLREEAEKEGKVLRYVGVIDGQTGEIKCSLEKYPATHPFATSLSGSDNIISFTTARYPAPRPLLVQGSGAGGDVTAMGVWADCLRVWERRA